MNNITVLYFGSFNPFHIGHAAIAKFVAELPWVDELCFVLSPKNPLKESNCLQDATMRWNDLQRVVEKLQKETPIKISATDIEFNLQPPLYTYNTLERLKELFPDKKFALLMGGDNIAIIEKWYKGLEIVEKYPVLVYPRKGFDTEALCKKYGAIFVDAPQIDVSSTQIRNLDNEGKDASHLRY